MGISPEQVANWPKSRAMVDAVMVAFAVVYMSPDGSGAG
jgi:hypothetical protein